MASFIINWARTNIEARTARLESRRAATMLEYVLIAGVVLGVAAGVFLVFKDSLTSFFSGTSDAIDGASNTVAP